MDYEDYVCGDNYVYDYETDSFASRTKNSWDDMTEDYWEEDYDAQYLEKLDNYDSIFNW